MDFSNKEAFDKLSSFYFETVIGGENIKLPSSMLSRIIPEMHKEISDLFLDKIIECDKKAYTELGSPEVSPLKEYLHEAEGNPKLPYINHALELGEIVSWFYDQTFERVGKSVKMYLPLHKMTDNYERKNKALYSLDFYNFWRKNVGSKFTEAFISKLPVIRTVSFLSMGYYAETGIEKEVWDKLYEDITNWYRSTP